MQYESVMSLESVVGYMGIVALLCAIAVRLMRLVAIKKAMYDIPNHRSAHSVPVPRLGGAVFIPIVFAASAALWLPSSLPFSVRASFFGASTAIFTVSLADDVFNLGAPLRFGIQFSSALVAVGTIWHSKGLGIHGGDAAALIIISLTIVALTNFYNFMDGIDGIAGTQAVVAGFSWWCIAVSLEAPCAANLAGLTAAGAFGFLTLNWPPARIFMGDAGSTVLGFTFGILPLLVSSEVGPLVPVTRLLVTGMLIVWPFLADGTFTIARRLRNRENIFKAHRSHLYQRLVLAGKSHLQVTLTYGLLAVIGAILASWVIIRGKIALLAAAVVVAVLFFLLWLWTLSSEKAAAER